MSKSKVQKGRSNSLKSDMLVANIFEQRRRPTARNDRITPRNRKKKKSPGRGFFFFATRSKQQTPRTLAETAHPFGSVHEMDFFATTDDQYFFSGTYGVFPVNINCRVYHACRATKGCNCQAEESRVARRQRNWIIGRGREPPLIWYSCGVVVTNGMKTWRRSFLQRKQENTRASAILDWRKGAEVGI